MGARLLRLLFCDNNCKETGVDPVVLVDARCRLLNLEGPISDEGQVYQRRNTPDAARLAAGLAHGKAPVSVLVAWLLPQLYRTADARAVLGFLDAYPFLAPLLLEAHRHICADFAAAPLFLEIFTDPEWPEHRQLLITISPLCPPPEALAQYRRLQQNWWLAAMPRAAGALALLVEYR